MSHTTCIKEEDTKKICFIEEKNIEDEKLDLSVTYFLALKNNYHILGV